MIKVSTSVTWGVGTSAEMSSLSSVVRSADYSFLTPFLHAMLALLWFCWIFYLFVCFVGFLFCFAFCFISVFLFLVNLNFKVILIKTLLFPGSSAFNSRIIPSPPIFH